MSSPVETVLGPLSWRSETADDAVFLFELFAACRSRDMASMPAGQAAKDMLLRMQFRSMTDTYRSQYPAARFEVAELAGQPVGRLVTAMDADCVRYVDIAVLPSCQRSGVATALLRAALAEPRRLGLPARASVLSTNAASLRMCGKLGFTVRAHTPPFVALEWRDAGGTG